MTQAFDDERLSRYVLLKTHWGQNKNKLSVSKQQLFKIVKENISKNVRREPKTPALFSDWPREKHPPTGLFLIVVFPPERHCDPPSLQLCFSLRAPQQTYVEGQRTSCCVRTAVALSDLSLLPPGCLLFSQRHCTNGM